MTRPSLVPESSSAIELERSSCHGDTSVTMAVLFWLGSLFFMLTTCALYILINDDGLDCKCNNRSPEVKGIIAAAQTFGTHTDLAVHVLKTIRIHKSTTNSQDGTHTQHTSPPSPRAYPLPARDGRGCTPGAQQHRMLTKKQQSTSSLATLTDFHGNYGNHGDFVAAHKRLLDTDC